MWLDCAEIVLEQYYRWPYNLDDEEIKDGFAEIVGDYFITAPTQLSAELLATRNVTVFLYNFDYFSIFDPWKGAKHGAELFYLSGYPLSGHINFSYNKMDQSMSTRLMQMWANFAQNGLPSLVPYEDFHMSPYTTTSPIYTQITAQDGQISMSMETSFKPEKMSFWNQLVPKLYMNQLRHDVQLLNLSPNLDIKLVSSFDSTKQIRDDLVRITPAYVHTQTSGSWILIAVCIVLSLLTLLLSICYCQVKRQVKTLIRQTSISSGEAIL